MLVHEKRNGSFSNTHTANSIKYFKHTENNQRQLLITKSMG